MKHNTHNSAYTFEKEPLEFNKLSDKDLLQFCLGGTLYMPATKSVVDKILDRSFIHLKSMVMCFEDAIKFEELGQAEKNALEHLDRIAEAMDSGALDINDVPLIFMRVRNTEQFKSFAERLNTNQAKALTGFVFPKFYSNNAHIYLQELSELNHKLGTSLYGMPILEGKTIAYSESRVGELTQLKSILDQHKDLILNVRVGGTDFSSLFGVRRGINSSIYDIMPVRDALSDILNFFNRAEDGYTVSAPVWEYFLAYKKDDIHEYLNDNIHRSLLNKEPILNEAIDGLLREVILDKANGMVGKTVIHPSHLKYVNAMQAVTLEEYQDAMQILDARGGVVKSESANKMNEIAPHTNWARRIEQRAMGFGVIGSESDYMQLFLGED
ncbi:ATP/GTP-binding protein [Aliidiomarina minuta]|uniref:ATP/GTP-binding protein n=1 Tax=Aliidiomarina minuta TaxID=880057 RepID=A0A432W8I3_9GAMM|nr:HpcH/HpaI aldolase/citrate lyase family protein [Aliidiomarina minuta]RUO26276.1 ATP/GTP-binding protein [Aliidiomarina minuta]